ncbi:hypothetical protein IV203_024311 [Nitzschia inconspicua]|uniref:Uncharacterized protein n=1 Tax=Nitzschia inconspicua TaxID=303405 RepID=A0A9K3PAY7_9STRA|nr:hypothetical protein IV203_024311 [Nitzschia inconspicua]
MIRVDDNDPAPLILANSPSFQEEMVANLLKKEFPEHYDDTFVWDFMAMVRDLSLNARAKLFNTEDALRARITNFQTDTSVDNRIVHRDEPVTWLQTAVWREQLCFSTYKKHYINLETGEEVSCYDFYIMTTQQLVFRDEVLWLPLAYQEVYLKSIMRQNIHVYNVRRTNRQRKKPMLPSGRINFMRYSYITCKSREHQFVRNMLSERMFGTFDWNLGCIADSFLRRNEMNGFGMWFSLCHPTTISQMYTISQNRYWALAMEAAFDALCESKKQRHGIRFYVEKYRWLFR